MSLVQIGVIETFHPDIVFSPFALALYGKAFGSKIRFFDNQPPNLCTPVIVTADDMDKFVIPDIDSNPTLLFIRSTVQKLNNHYNNVIPVAAIALNPIDMPIMIMGIDGWMDTLLFHKRSAGQMLEKITPFFISWANTLFEEGADFIVMPAPFANPSIITRDIITDIVIPALNEAFSRIKGPLVMHSAGAMLVPFIDIYAGLPNVTAIIINGAEDFHEARMRIRKELTLIGNIDGPTLINKNPEDIRVECNKLLLDRKNDMHFILGTSAADIPINTPAENIHALRLAVEEFI